MELLLTTTKIIECGYFVLVAGRENGPLGAVIDSMQRLLSSQITVPRLESTTFISPPQK